MRKIGVILARLQPVHNGHLALIEKSIQENEETYIFVGSANKFNQRNPLPISLRLLLIKEALVEKFGWNSIDYIVNDRGTEKKLYVLPLDDLTSEGDNSHTWGFYFYSKVVTATQCSNFTIYYSDGFEIITTWFPSYILRNNVSLSLLARGATIDGISATKIREAILQGNDELLKQYVPNTVYEHRSVIKNHIELSNLIQFN